jgi:hypothetical protein
MNNRYTQSMLTIIAGALVALVTQNAIRPVGAQNGVQRVQICDSYRSERCARVAERGSDYEFSNTNFLMVSPGN